MDQPAVTRPGLRRRKPYLVDNRLLGADQFKERVLCRDKAAAPCGQAAIRPAVARSRTTRASCPGWTRLRPRTGSSSSSLRHRDSTPAHVLKYLARYLTGGPISDRRLLSHEEGQVTFLARSKNKQTGNQPRPVPLPGVEFVRLLESAHLAERLHQGAYLRRLSAPAIASPTSSVAATLLKITADEEPDEQCGDDLREETEKSAPTCPHCQCEMVCLQASQRPSWRDLFARLCDLSLVVSRHGLSPSWSGRVPGAEP